MLGEPEFSGRRIESGGEHSHGRSVRTRYLAALDPLERPQRNTCLVGEAFGRQPFGFPSRSHGVGLPVLWHRAIVPAYVGRKSDGFRMTAQLPAFRLTVAAGMDGYRERLAANIARERKRRGESPLDLAVAIGVDKRTVERWESGERDPQTKKLKALADHWDLDVGVLRPDLEAEERAVRAQLDRIEAMLEGLYRALIGEEAPAAMAPQGRVDHPLDQVVAPELEAAAEERELPPARTARAGNARARAGRKH